jgi:[glutamine synthetase] adenylyltransferase / [glutamine synthetase]-adenylyl-L-tyrosine phosphorylase
MEKFKAGFRNPVWTEALAKGADPHRARHYLGLLSETEAVTVLKKASAEQARILAAVLSGSQALSGVILAQPGWLEILSPEQLEYGRRKQGFFQELRRNIEKLENSAPAGALAEVRQFKAREMLRVGARDLANLATVSEIIAELSDVADVCLESVWRICVKQCVQKYGRPYHLDVNGRWQPTSACVLGMGKLGGRELNYSSDVDVLFVYSEEGTVQKTKPSDGKKAAGTSRPGLTNHQFFNRLAETFIAEVTRLGPHGALYRVDLRLRPEGDTGPLTRSVNSYETYYSQWGQTWERMMLIKARCVAGDESVASEFLETVQPFRFPRLISEGVLKEVGAMKDRIESEVVRADELDRNVKLGRGGIREIEFTAQALQLLHGGRQPFLQGAQTLPTLEKLAQYELISGQAWRELRDAYGFLRNVEHRLQMENDQQTHTIPTDKSAQLRLAKLMGFAGQKQFERARGTHCARVRATFESVLKREVPAQPDDSKLPRGFHNAEADWTQLLQRHRFKDIDRAFAVLREFVEGPGYVHVSERTRELAYQLLPRILKLCPATQSDAGKGSAGDGPKIKGLPEMRDKSARSADQDRLSRLRSFGLSHRNPAETSSPILSDPDRVVTRLDNFIAAYGARSTLFELWNSNPAVFEMLLLLFDRSEFLAELAIRSPDLVDELVAGGRLRQRKTVEETLRDLRHGLKDKDQMLWLRRYHQAEVMRIGLRDILGLADEEQYLTELSTLADACLKYALEACLYKHRIKSAPFVIIGLGKLGGEEIDYGSDLDLLFVADWKAKNLLQLKSLALEILELLSRRTEQGILFHTDARLRPDGEKGLLVNTLEAYEQYYHKRAQLWEIQTLTRCRAIAGDLKLGEQFQKLAAGLTDFSKPPPQLACYSEDWKRKIHQMRLRIEKERTPRGQEDLAIKTGSGGLMDAEFVAQTLCLKNGWQEANTLRALQRGASAGVLPDATQLIESYRQLRRLEGILRRWSYEGETVLPADPAPFYRVAVRCGFESPDAFREAVRNHRKAIRQVYDKVFGLAA